MIVLKDQFLILVFFGEKNKTKTSSSSILYISDFSLNKHKLFIPKLSFLAQSWWPHNRKAYFPVFKYKHIPEYSDVEGS